MTCLLYFNMTDYECYDKKYFICMEYNILKNILYLSSRSFFKQLQDYWLLRSLVWLRNAIFLVSFSRVFYTLTTLLQTICHVQIEFLQNPQDFWPLIEISISSYGIYWFYNKLLILLGSIRSFLRFFIIWLFPGTQDKWPTGRAAPKGMFLRLAK